ncbi:uncharacterized protein F4807DRAFT_413750 [Annulohypoxylon truncatum]|uniref:uncharacterized protein n=1 Tax=Annulohypoxylon truncatum TaxID=327061 RepID=UPI002008629D|nr:uncharacterized protein F4807DRAFT_413750 [Annulohypoxylon truncatum]KAI1212612.1 hypothetical protein F4807DRAFT_413750 [Annulohypoxylon truncatum]
MVGLRKVVSMSIALLRLPVLKTTPNCLPPTYHPTRSQGTLPCVLARSQLLLKQRIMQQQFANAITPTPIVITNIYEYRRTMYYSF